MRNVFFFMLKVHYVRFLVYYIYQHNVLNSFDLMCSWLVRPVISPISARTHRVFTHFLLDSPPENLLQPAIQSCCASSVNHTNTQRVLWALSPGRIRLTELTRFPWWYVALFCFRHEFNSCPILTYCTFKCRESSILWRTFQVVFVGRSVVAIFTNRPVKWREGPEGELQTVRAFF